jgi:hypothetical protein
MNWKRKDHSVIEVQPRNLPDEKSQGLRPIFELNTSRTRIQNISAMPVWSVGQFAEASFGIRDFLASDL